MNLLKALFSVEVEEDTFFDTIHPLTNNFTNDDRNPWDQSLAPVATTKTEITPGRIGHVKFQGVRWRALCDRPFVIPIGTQVRVLGRRANILVVEPTEACVTC